MNQLNMHNDETDVIRYLMKEMDPSEEVLMERAMMEDDDLLIEVESMRQTMQRLDELPDKKPSAELSASIIEQAANHKKRTSFISSIPTVPTEVYKYAAVLIIGMGLGSGIWMYMDSSSDNSVTTQQSAAITSPFKTSSQQGANLDPWVDRENVIYYQDMFERQSSDYNAILETSMHKLKPVEGPFNQNPSARDVQLTGSKH